MNSSEIDVSHLLASPSYDPWNCSNSVVNLGPCASRLTWEASKREAQGFSLTDEQKEAFRDHCEASGGWTREEINTWDDAELIALCVQWISGDIRESFGDDLPDDPSEWDWETYRENLEDGRVSGSLFLHEGKLLWSCSS